MTEFFTMIARIITLKSNRKMGVKSTEKAKNIDQIQLYKWVYLQMGMESLWHSTYSPEIKTNRHP